MIQICTQKTNSKTEGCTAIESICDDVMLNAVTELIKPYYFNETVNNFFCFNLSIAVSVLRLSFAEKSCRRYINVNKIFNWGGEGQITCNDGTRKF